MKLVFELIITSKQRQPLPGRCIGCGCTNRLACDGGCTWVDADHLLCSRCIERVAGIHDGFDHDGQPLDPIRFTLRAVPPKKRAPRKGRKP